MTGRWPYIFVVLFAAPFGGHAFATDTFSTEGLVNLHDVRGTGHAYTEILSDAQVCLKISGTSSYLQFADGSGDACTHITPSSSYFLGGVELPNDPTTVQYVIITNGEQLDVRDSNNDYHKLADPNTELIRADYRLIHNIRMPYDTNKALWLYHDWRVFTGFVANEFGKTMDLDLNVMYEEGEFDRTRYIDNKHELTFQGDGLMNNYNAVLDQWTVFHEFSHHLMNEAYDDYFAPHRTYPASCVDGNSQTLTISSTGQATANV